MRRSAVLFLLALILLTGLFARLHGISRESIWWDDFTSVMHLEPPQEWQDSPDYVRWNQTVIRGTSTGLLDFLRKNRSLDPATMPFYYTFEYLWNHHRFFFLRRSRARG